jgi:hypothetical protein
MPVLPAHLGGVPKYGPTRLPAWCGFIASEPGNPDDPNDPGNPDDPDNPGDPGITPPPPENIDQWFVLVGDSPMDVRKTLAASFVIPAGQSRVVIVALFSEEFPQYTGTNSEYNDILEWAVGPLSGSIRVNSAHHAWATRGIALNGYSPVIIESKTTLAAPAGAPLTVPVSLAATNISDSLLPSVVMVGVFLP